MNTDWSKYPALPEPPKLPEWRDTPEHEAYWNEVCAIKTPAEKKSGCIAGVILWGVFIAIFLFHVRQYDFWNICGIAILTLAPVWIVWYIFFWIWFGILKRKISKKYGFSIRKLNRLDLTPEIRAVLAGRPDFSENEFRQYWQDAGQAGIAEDILKVVNRSWYLHKKMLYPNDPLLLLFYGREVRLGKEKMIGTPEYFFLDLEDDIDFFYENWDAIEFFYENWDAISCGTTTFAELVEHHQTHAAKQEK